MDEFKDIVESFDRIKKNYDNGHYVEFPRDKSIQPYCQESAIETLLDDQEVLIAEVKRLKERNAQITQNYNKRVEKYYYLKQEVRRLKEENGNQARELENTEREAEGIHQESQLYKDLYTKENIQNMVYKDALNEIAKSTIFTTHATDREMFLIDIFIKLVEIATKALKGERE